MCGIFGAVGEKIEKYKEADKMSAALDALSKRGPDDCGSLPFNKCVLGQTRLSIIDLASGHQPMKDNRKDIAISFNGEIYNYRELKKELEEKGHKFSTNSDTEVILKAYIEYGADCPKRLNGMFAFAIWDNEKEELFMARDRFGQKPLYYAFDEAGNLLFASEIKALLRVGIKGEIDFQAIDDYLRKLYISPDKSIYKNIQNLKPARSAIFKNGEIAQKRYWKLPDSPLSITREEARKKLEFLLEQAVERRMVADVEVGSMLSGGVDSSIVTYYAQKHAEHPIKTFSVGFENFINELPFAKEVADALGTDHHELVTDIDIAKELREMAEYFDEPHADAATIPTRLISKLARRKVKVLLSGDGADELFYGYGWAFKHHNLDSRKKLKQFLLSDPFKDYLKAVTCFGESERKKLWKDGGNINEDFQSDFTGGKKVSAMRKINLFDIYSYLPGDLLAKLDRASMMESVEVRSPFLDHELAEFAYNLPEKFKADNNGSGKFGTKWGGKWESKILLKEVARKFLPQAVADRKKQGFGPPIKQWMEKESMKNLVDELFLSNEAGIYEFMNKNYIKEVISNFYEEGKAPYRVWVLVCLELWHKNNKKHFK